MGVWAWTSGAEVIISSRKVKKAYEAIKEGYGSGKIRKGNYDSDKAQKFEQVKDMEAFLKFQCFTYEKAKGQWKITSCDIDKMNDEFCDIFETLAPFVIKGSYIKIEDEEGSHLLMAFDGKKVQYFGDAY